MEYNSSATYSPYYNTLDGFKSPENLKILREISDEDYNICKERQILNARYIDIMDIDFTDMWYTPESVRLGGLVLIGRKISWWSLIEIALEFRVELELYGHDARPKNVLTSLVNVVLDLDNPDWIAYEKSKLKNPVEIYSTGIYVDAIRNKEKALERTRRILKNKRGVMEIHLVVNGGLSCNF